MGKISLFIAALIVLTGSAQASSYFDTYITGDITGSAANGSSLTYHFSVANFDTSLGTLTGITISYSLNTWGGLYEIEERAALNSTVNLFEGISALSSGSWAGPNTSEINLKTAGERALRSGPILPSYNSTGLKTGQTAFRSGLTEF